ncbi:MAG: hypothetical protein AB7E55_34755 [Pigmentiphaga sp.]
MRICAPLGVGHPPWRYDTQNRARIVRPESVFGHPVAAGIGFHQVYPESLREDRRLDNLRHWLRGQSQVSADT